MKTVFLISIIAVFFSSCDKRNLGECSSVDCAFETSVGFKIINHKERDIVDSLIKVKSLRYEMLTPETYTSNEINFQVSVSEDDEIEIYYNDTLKVKAQVGVIQIPGECCSIYRTRNIKINGETKCTTDCQSQTFEVEL